jgi:hypothetical protein
MSLPPSRPSSRRSAPMGSGRDVERRLRRRRCPSAQRPRRSSPRRSALPSSRGRSVERGSRFSVPGRYWERSCPPPPVTGQHGTLRARVEEEVRSSRTRVHFRLAGDPYGSLDVMMRARRRRHHGSTWSNRGHPIPAHEYDQRRRARRRSVASCRQSSPRRGMDGQVPR